MLKVGVGGEGRGGRGEGLWAGDTEREGVI